MVWQSALFIGALIGIPIAVAWRVGGAAAAKRQGATSNAEEPTSKRAEKKTGAPGS
jgi:hypothetical protein